MEYIFIRAAEGSESVEHRDAVIATSDGRHGFEMLPGFEGERFRLALACKRARSVGFWSDDVARSVTVTLTPDDLERADAAENVAAYHRSLDFN